MFLPVVRVIIFLVKKNRYCSDPKYTTLSYGIGVIWLPLVLVPFVTQESLKDKEVNVIWHATIGERINVGKKGTNLSLRHSTTLTING